MPKESLPVSVCTSCALILANGCDCSLSLCGTYGHFDACHALDMSDSEITIGCGDDSCSDCAGESSRFSSSRCDCCGDTLGGDRHCAVTWWSEPEVPGSAFTYGDTSNHTHGCVLNALDLDLACVCAGAAMDALLAPCPAPVTR